MSSEEEEDTIVAYLAYKMLSRKRRKIWVKPDPINKRRDTNTSGIMMKLYPHLVDDDENFYNFARMSKNTFEELLTLVGEQIYKPDTNFKKAIPPEERLLLTLRFLATGETSQSLHFQFKMGASTVRQIVYEVCDAIWKSLKKTEMPRLTERALKDIANGFWEKWNFPHCLGAIDGKHIQIQCPGTSGSTVVVQGVADADGNFIVVDVGDFGKHSDGGVLKQSAFGRALYANQLPIPKADTDIKNNDLNELLPYVFIGDAAYPLLKNLLRPYPLRGLDNTKRIYNYRHSCARRSVESAFGLMATKWAVLQGTLTINPTHAVKVILTCCVLHNYVHHRESTDVTGGQAPYQLSTTSNRSQWNYADTDSQKLTGRPSQEAMETRDKFAQLFISTLSVPWQNDAAHVNHLPEISNVTASVANPSPTLPLSL